MKIGADRFSARLLLLGVSALGMAAAAAAEVAPEAATSAAAPDDATALAEVVVTATKRAENTLEVPIAITAKSSEDLNAAQVVNVSELTAVVPGLNYTNGAAARPNLRGVTSLSSAAGAENNVAIYMDGIYQPDIYGNTFDMPDVANVEVLKGPQGTLFGRNASGGAILVSSRNPTFTPSGTIEVSDGTYAGGYKGGNDVKLTGFLSAPVSDTVAASISGLYQNDTGYFHDILRGGRTGKIDSSFVRGKLLFKPTDAAEVLVSAYYGKRTDNSVYQFVNLNPLKAVPAAPMPTEAYQVANDSAGLFEVIRYGGSIKGTLTTGVGTITSLSGISVVRPQIVADADGTSAPLTVYLLGQPNRSVSQEFDFASNTFAGISFVSGAYAYNSVESFTPLQVAASITGPFYYTDYAKSTDDAYALFTEANYKPVDRLTLVAGIRYSAEERQYQGSFTNDDPLPMIAKAHFSAFTPRFSIRYDVAEQTNVYFTYSKGFKSGLFDTSSFSPAVIQPETLKAYELGIKSSPMPSLLISASVYHYDGSNLQVQTNTAAGLAALSNAGAAEINGGEFEVEWRAMRQLTLSTGWSFVPTATYHNYPNAPIVAPDLVNGGGFNTTINGTGLRLAQTPRVQGNVQVRYNDDFSFGKVSADLTAFHSGGFAYELSNFVYQKSYSLVNASLSWNPSAAPGVKLGLWGKNLTNTRWIGNYLSNGTAFDAVYQAPREIGLSAGYSF